MPSMQTTIVLGATLLGSLIQHVAAAPEASSKRAAIQFPDCISTCMRNSGCFDADCICDKAGSGILSDIVICMNQWCPADVTATDLIEPLEGKCDLPKTAVQDAEKKGGVANDAGGDEEETPSTTSAKPTATSSKKGNDDEDDSPSKSTPTAGSKGGDDKEDVTATFDLGSPQTNAVPATTVTPAVSGTLTVAAATSTAAGADGLLTDDDAKPTGAGSFGAATSISVTPSSTAAKSESTGSADDEDNAARLSGQASIFGVVAAMGAALALGF
ncbi:hypothetical protein F5B22DRAFT_393627 [Xylaria bambusicola]|uniref:uncharacterized protein n=1 Tax=Xylaria bambusicola TaxID=326684 RepID=UPI002008155E|nr:uncharacterized protein F5B22DRAFT_393627 [Xylaria bambusicola]KAI0508599.1 hypothetical protein F5B22DRAFT_393627 [Xylaria bambusicola]